MSKSETNPKHEIRSKHETPNRRADQVRPFGVCHSVLFRISTFGFRVSPEGGTWYFGTTTATSHRPHGVEPNSPSRSALPFLRFSVTVSTISRLGGSACRKAANDSRCVNRIT